MKRPSANAATALKKFKPVEIGQDLGIILSVTLQNFMCHDHLKFDFDPHINFIIGRNGSGKSAILTAIILALGGKSSITGRYKNVKGFVKTGKNKAHVSVTLKNCGQSAYKPEIYGDKIIVEREFNLDGHSNYKLKSAAGKIESTLKEELNNVLIAMDITVDNPVLVLTQETSRSFLNADTGKKEKLYEFFYKGTGLEKLDIDYKACIGSLEDCAQDLAAKKQALFCMEKEVKRLEKLRESDEKLDELKRESFWARVTSMEKVLEEKKTRRDKLIKQIEITKREAEKSKNRYNEESLLLESAEKNKAELDEKIGSERKLLQELSEQSGICSEEVQKCQGRVDLYKREERKLLEDIRVIQETIDDHQMKDKRDYEEEKRRREEQICALQEKLTNVENQHSELETKLQYLLQQQQSKYQEINVLNTEINDLNSKKNMRAKEYTQLVNAKKNRQILFGEYTTQVLQDIERNRRNFIKMPKGPIGLDIEIKDPKWNYAVEACIKQNMLRSFCADNSKDSMVLTQILQKYYSDRMPSVIVSPFLPHVHDVSRHKAQTNFPTVLDMLIVKDPVIANFLIDQVSIENIILIEDITTANNIMLDNPPRQCYSAFLQNCDEILLNPYRFYSASRKSTGVLSQTVDENYLQKLQEDMYDLERQKQVKHSEINEANVELKNYQVQLKEIERNILKLRSVKHDIHGKIEELKQFEEPRNVPEMHDELSSLNDDLQQKQEKLRMAEEKLADLTMKSREAHEKKVHQKHRVTTMNQEFQSLSTTITQCSKNKEVLASSKKQFETELKADERELSKMELEIQKDENDIKNTISKREEVDKKRRIPTKRSYEEIDVQITELQKVISEQSNSKNKASLLEKYIEKSKKLLEAKNIYKRIEQDHMVMKVMMKKRKKRALEIAKYYQFVVNLSFEVILFGNGFTGKLDFSKENALQLQAAPNRKSSETGGKKSTSSLSGGERSFVTIAFLLALWDRIKMPFRILDEYDVFMDSNNRHLSINLLISKATQNPDIQFIFLSPQELPAIKDKNAKFTVHQMPDPERIGLRNMEE